MVRRGGFTLIELLVATALTAVAAGVIAAAFSAGFRVWYRASQQGGAYGDALLAFETIARDIRNTTPNRVVAFRGEETALTIPSIMQGVFDGTNHMGSIRYEFNSVNRSLDRVVVPVEFPGPGRDSRETMATGVTGVHLAYADAGANGGASIAWLGEWTGRTNAPVAVRVKLELLQGDETIEFERTTVLPCR